jgi:hypothetical protein
MAVRRQGSVRFYATASTFTIAQPITQSAVFNLTNSGAQQQVIGQSSVPDSIGISATANKAMVTAGSEQTAARPPTAHGVGFKV